MPDTDELLHQYLKALENGTPLEEVLERLPEEAGDLVPLIRLAATIRSLPHPEAPLEATRARKSALLAAARQKARAVGRPEGNGRQPMEWGSLGWALAPALAGITLLLVIVAASLFGLGLWPWNSQVAQTATLMEVDGQVEFASAHISGVWKTAAEGTQVRAGQRIRTHADSSVTLVFFDGSRTTLGPDTDVTLAKIDGGWGNVIQVALTQTAGKSMHSVIPFDGENSSFVVFTPSGYANVHGATFSVAVDASGRARFSVASGEVLVKNEESQVSLLSGQATAAQQDERFDPPNYQFTLQGELIAKGETTWVISGIEFTVVPGEISASDEPQGGEDVIVEARVLESGELVADSITVASDSSQYGSFTGILESIGAVADAEGHTMWVVDGQDVLVDGDTDLSEVLQEGDPVRVTFKILKDGHWLASRVESLLETSGEPTPEPSPEPSETSPDEIATTTAPPTITVPPTTTAPPTVTVPPTITVLPTASITPTTSITPTASVTPTATMPQTVMVTPTATTTPTATAPPTVTATPTTTATILTSFVTCTGAELQLEGSELTQRHGAPHEESMGWLCQGYGFGRIDLALRSD